MNDQNERKYNLLKLKKKVLYMMLGIIYISFIGIQLYRFNDSSSYSPTLLSLLLLPGYIAMLVIPIMFLLYVFLSLKVYKMNRYTAPFIYKDLLTMKFVLTVASILLIFTILIYQS